MTPREFFAFARKNKAEMVDLKFTDFLGTWQHCSFPHRHVGRKHIQGRRRFRRLVDPRLAGDRRIGHAGDP